MNVHPDPSQQTAPPQPRRSKDAAATAQPKPRSGPHYGTEFFARRTLARVCLLQDLVQSCLRGEGGILEDMRVGSCRMFFVFTQPLHVVGRGYVPTRNAHWSTYPWHPSAWTCTPGPGASWRSERSSGDNCDPITGLFIVLAVSHSLVTVSKMSKGQ
jgi:hypothetical protein